MPLAQEREHGIFGASFSACPEQKNVAGVSDPATLMSDKLKFKSVRFQAETLNYASLKKAVAQTLGVPFRSRIYTAYCVSACILRYFSGNSAKPSAECRLFCPHSLA